MTRWTLRLIVANAAVFLLQLLVGDSLTYWLGLIPGAVLTRPWTPITYMFLHGGILHILFNMIVLFFFGPRLEDRLGARHFLGLYFVSGLAGAALSIITPNALIIGASGAIFGVMVGFAYYWPRAQIYIWGILPVEARVFVIGLALLSLWLGYRGGSGIANFCHLGGFAGGFLYLKARERWSAGARFRARAQPTARKTSPKVSDLTRWRAIRTDTMHPVNRDELNRILDKISATGLESLTPDERAFLDRFSGGN